MTNLQRWKAERIKEIEDMDIDRTINYICYLEPFENCCDWCINKEKECEAECGQGIKAYLESEEE